MPSPSLSRCALSRRTALLGAVVLGTAGCTPYSLGEDHERAGDLEPAPPSGPRADPDVALAAAVLAAEQSLVDLVDATLEEHPRLAGVLASTRATHTAHIDLLADAAPDGPSASAAPESSLGPSPAPGPRSGPRVPPDPEQALRAVARHEDELSLADKRSAFAAESGSFARVLASMAAAAAQQSAALRATRLREVRR